MTVPSETNRSGPYNGNGVTTVFSYGFRILDEAHLRVVLTSALGTETTLTIDADYIVSDVGDPGGGQIAVTVAPATGETITILRDVPFTQETDLENQGAYYAETVEDALDLAAMRDQQLEENIGRTLQLPASYGGSVDTTLPAPEANKIIGWNEAADALQNVDPSTLATIISYGTANADIFTGDGATLEFPLSGDPGTINNLDVAIGGVTQLPGVDYTWSAGTVLTFTTAPADGVSILVRYMQGLAQGTSEAGLVAYTQAYTGAVQQNVEGHIARRVDVEDFSTGIPGADEGASIKQAIDGMKQATSISYNPTTIPMDARSSLGISGQHIVKQTLDLWAKLTVRALNALNSGLTYAADAAGDALFRLSGSTALPAWGNQNKIIGGAYNILKAGAALVRKHPDFPRAYNAPGGSFMTNYTIRDLTFAGPYGIQLGDVYSQNALIANVASVGTVEQILSIQGHHILIDGLDKTGYTGTTTEPLIVLGDPDNINPTTNITLSRCILDLNGNANKDSVHVVNAKNTLIVGHHNELTLFNHMLVIEDSYGTKLERSMFVTSITTDVVTLDNSDLQMDYFEANTISGKWWEFFTRTNKSPLRIGRLRQYYSAVLPIDEDITVKEIQNVSGAEPMIDVPFMNLAGNVCKNPGFVDGATGWSAAGSPTVTLVAGNKVVPGGKILRLTWPSDTPGVHYITQSLAGMAGAEFTGRPMTFIMIGEVTGTYGDSLMGPAETGLGINQGRIHGGQGLVSAGAVIVGSNGTAYFHVTNPKAGAQYDIHYLCAQFGRQMTPVLPIPMQPLVADPAGGATIDTQARTQLAAVIDALQAAGIMRTT